jgi:hypothetical protein
VPSSYSSAAAVLCFCTSHTHTRTSEPLSKTTVQPHAAAAHQRGHPAAQKESLRGGRPTPAILASSSNTSLVSFT